MSNAATHAATNARHTLCKHSNVCSLQETCAIALSAHETQNLLSGNGDTLWRVYTKEKGAFDMFSFRRFSQVDVGFFQDNRKNRF